MNILSYRGPSSAGGVSGALSRLIEQTGAQRWWYLDGQDLSSRWTLQSASELIHRISPGIVAGHYRYCNNFLWPILHDLPEFATFNSLDKLHYKQFNLIFANNILKSNHTKKRLTCHINDYQMALTAKFIEASTGNRDTSIFWHVPWPKHVSPEYIDSLVEIADGLLSSRQIGFHVTEYATNFLTFINENMKDYIVDWNEKRVVHKQNNRRITTIVAMPLGLDFDYWSKQSQACNDPTQLGDLSTIVSGQFVLSVDRMDYTKGVLQRIEAIDRFFAKHETWTSRICFLQVCQRSRPGLPAFDEYWQTCQTRAQEVNSRWQKGDWRPVVWVEHPLSSEILAQLYSRATAMLITPLRDGLNLTAKEFAACSEAGVLLLSPGAGAWHELRDHALSIEPSSANKMSDQILEALTMPEDERRKRLEHLKRTLEHNTLAFWWQQFSRNFEKEKRVVQISDQNHRTSEHPLLLAR